MPIISISKVISSPLPLPKLPLLKGEKLLRLLESKPLYPYRNPNMAIFFREGLLEMIGTGLDFVFANESEALTISGSDEIESAIAYFKTIAKGFAITRGASGSLIYDGENLLEIDPHPVQAIDTVGAGDMYAGAFLYGITHGMGYKGAGNLASLSGCPGGFYFGARLQTEEIQSLRDSIVLG
jgi:sugar/nucleoside kinase (ribokinase family)